MRTIYLRTNPYLDGTYLERVKDWHASDSPWKAMQVLKMIEKHRLSLNSVFDIGCGAGEVLVELQRKITPTVDFIGFDISPQAISIAKPKENDKLKFSNEDFLTADVSPPDLLLLLDVFEHVPDYLGFLDILRQKARWIIFHIPLDINVKGVLRKSNWMLLMRENYGHLHYFTKESAIATLADIGFGIIDYQFTDDFDVAEFMHSNNLRQRMIYEIRKHLFRINKGLAASIFEHFNLLLLAQGDQYS